MMGRAIAQCEGIMVGNEEVFALAKQGNSRAIATLLNRVLQGYRLSAQVRRKKRGLHILIEGDRVPSPENCVQFIRKGLLQLDLESIDSVRIYGRPRGSQTPVWHQAFELKSSVKKSSKTGDRTILAGGLSPQKNGRSLQVNSSRKRNKNKRDARLQMPYFVIGLLGLSSLLIGSSWGAIATTDPQDPLALFAAIEENLGSVTLSVPKNPLKSQTSVTPLQPLAEEKVIADYSQVVNNFQTSIPSTSITIKAVGDIVPGTNFPSHKLPQDPHNLFASVKPYLQGADLLFGNFESTLTEHPFSSKNVSGSMTFAFRNPPAYAKILKEVGFDILNLANNHSFDFGEVGIQETIASLKAVGITPLGQKDEIIYLTIKNIPVAFIGFSPYDAHNSVLDLATTKALVEKASKNASIVIVSMHAGAEGSGAVHVSDRSEIFYGENRGNVVAFARTAIDAGADLVLGHGPHVPRALELYKGKLIAYSLGNFIGYRTLSTGGNLSYSLILETELDIEGNLIAGKVIPVYIQEPGIPYIDQYFRSVQFLRNLIESDFPNTPLAIDRRGQLVVKEL
jgi:hypothetical protein